MSTSSLPDELPSKLSALSRVYCWGGGLAAPLTLAMPAGDTHVTQVSAGRTQKAAVTQNGHLIVWEVGVCHAAASRAVFPTVSSRRAIVAVVQPSQVGALFWPSYNRLKSVRYSGCRTTVSSLCAILAVVQPSQVGTLFWPSYNRLESVRYSGCRTTVLSRCAILAVVQPSQVGALFWLSYNRLESVRYSGCRTTVSSRRAILAVVQPS